MIRKNIHGPEELSLLETTPDVYEMNTEFFSRKGRVDLPS